MVCARHAAAHRAVTITAAHDAPHRADLQQVHSSRAACALDSPAIVPHHTRDRTGGIDLWSLVPPRSGLDLFLFSTAVRTVQCAASKGSFSDHQGLALRCHRAVSVPSMVSVGSVLNFRRARVRPRVAATLVITQEQIASAHRAEGMWERCERVASHVA